MQFLTVVVIYILYILCFGHGHRKEFGGIVGFPRQQAMKLRVKISEKLARTRSRNTATVCYDVVGCFDLPHKRSPLQKMPENPEMVETKFFLFRRDINFSEPQILNYADKSLSLSVSNFNPKQALKVVIHGYMSRWNNEGALKAAAAFLKICDCNIILLDWEKGAKGPQYATAAANTELVGRQMGLLLLDMVDKGLNPDDVHLMGFSLGAHIAGCASELLKIRGHLIGRITGLDAASPLFRSNHLREKYKKLDQSDARYVDVIHTDASPTFTDGFGIIEPIGHVDFFPNGGQEQPGCVDGRRSVVVSHFDRSLTKAIACSHLRAWQLFLETLLNKAYNTSECELTSFKCDRGLDEFQSGLCFPETPRNSLALNPKYVANIGKLGIDARGEGIMYLVTRKSSPFCGSQLQSSVDLSDKIQSTPGMLQMQLQLNHSTAEFQIQFNSLNVATRVAYGLAAIDFNGVNERLQSMIASLNYLNWQDGKNNISNSVLYIAGIVVRDMNGNRWTYGGPDIILEENTSLKATLSRQTC